MGLIAASGKVGIQMMAEIYQRDIDGLGLPAGWALSIMVPIFKGKGDIRNCSCQRAVNLLELEIKVMTNVSEKRRHIIVTVNETQFGSMSERGAIDGVFIMKRLQEEYLAKGKKLYMCLVGLESAFDRIIILEYSYLQLT